MIKTICPAPGVTLRCCQDKRFKQGRLSLLLVRPMCREEAALNALLPAVLLRGTKRNPDLRDITLRLDDLYGAAVGTQVRRVGDYQAPGLICNFIEDRFALPGDQVLAPMTDFLRELLLEPVLEDGAFRADFVEGEKRNLISAIAAQKNDKRSYAMSCLQKKMCAEDSFGISRLGEIPDVEAITPQGLYAHYENILKTSPMELFYVGSQEPEQVAELLKPLFVCQNPMALPPQTALKQAPAGAYREQMEVTQGRLCLGFTTPTTIRDPGFAAMQVFNSVFGSGMTCKLFMQVREKLSLCYDISSAYTGTKAVITVGAGIDFAKKDLAQSEILAQLEACRQGDITPGELESAKQGIISQLRTTHDSPGAIESYYSTGALNGLPMTPEQYIRAVEQVSLEQVAEAARSVTLHTEFFLEGVQA